MPELFEDSLHSSLIPTKAASELSGYNADYLARLCRENKIQGTQVGRSWLINRASLEAFVKAQEEKKRERAEELRAARGKEYRKAQKPILRAVRSTATATKEAVVKHVPSPREFVPVASPFIAKARGAEAAESLAPAENTAAHARRVRAARPASADAQPTYSRPLAALAVSLAVVAGSAYASTNDGVLRALSVAPRIALSAADAASPMHLLAYSPLLASDADMDALASADAGTMDASLARAAGMNADVSDARSALALSMPSASGVSGAFASFGAVAIASGVESVHALTDDARAPFGSTDTAHAAHARIASVSSVAHHPLAAAVRAYVYSGMYALASGDAFGDAYLSLISHTGDRALAIAAGTRDTIALGQRASMAVLDGYAHGVYAWNTAAPKAAGTAVLALYDAGNATNRLAEALPSTAREGKDALAYGIVDASQAISGAVTSTEASALAAAFSPFSGSAAGRADAGVNGAPAAAQLAQSAAASPAHTGALSSTLAFADRLHAEVIETEGALAALPIRAEDTMLGMAGYAASLVDGTERTVPAFATAGDASSASTGALAVNGAPAYQASTLPASVAAILPASWERALEGFFSNSHTLAHALFTSGFHTLATLLPGGSVMTPALTVVDTSPVETLALPTPAGTLTRPIGIGAGSGGTTVVTNTGPVQNIINNYFPQTIAGGSINDAVLALIKPYVRDSVDSALRNVDRNSKDYVQDDGGTLSNVTINSGDATLATLIADLADITRLHVGELDAGTTTLGELTASSTNINGDLDVSGALTVGSITVSGVSSGGAITAPYFTATDTAATSTFPNVAATTVAATNGIFDTLTAGKIGIGTSSPLVSLDISGTDAIRIPVGTTAERPLASGAGLVRYNTTTHQFEGFGDSGVWQGLGGVIDADQDTYITADTNNANENTLRFYTAGGQRMTIAPSGNVGIGTTTPYATLSVGGDLALTGGLYDGNAQRGAPGQILTSTGTGVQWVSTTTFSGSGSGLDADLLDGLDSTYFLANAFSTTSTDYWLGTKTTDDLTEGSNLYYTQARFDAAFAGKSTTNLVEGTNLYFTNVRARTALSAGTGIGYDSATGEFSNTGVLTFNGRTGAVAPAAGDYTTDLVSEGTTNKYYTDARARLALSSSAAGIDYDSSTGIFSLSSGYAIPLSASTTAWQAFYDVPSSRIAAGTNLSWSGNTINGPSDSYIRSLFSGTSPIGYDAGTGAFSLSTAGDWSGTFDGHEGAYYLANAFSTTSADAWLTTKSTDDLAEGSTNKYYTDARARGALSGSSGISYDSGTGVFSLVTTGDWTGTFDGQEGNYYLDRANHTGTQPASTISDFTSAARSLFSAQSPLTYSSATGEFSIGGGTGAVPIASGGTNATSQTTNGVAYYDGSKITTGTGLVYAGGKLGIGTTTPSSALSVGGNALVDGGITATGATINGTASVQNLAVGSLSGFLKATAGTVGTALVDLSTDVTSTLPQANGGTGFTAYDPGDILVADNTGALTKLPAGASGQVLKIQAGIPSWGADQTIASDGSDGIFATSTGIIYPINTAVVTIFGSNATSTPNSILEVHGQEYVSGKLGIGTTSPSTQLSVGGNGLFSGNVTAGGAVSAASLSAASLTLGGSSFTSLLGTGLVNDGGMLSVSTSSLGFASATTTAALTASLSDNYAPKWDASTHSFTNSLIYDSGTQVGIGTASNLNGALTANGTFSVQAEGDIFRQYDSGDGAWYPVIARYDTNNGTFPGSTYIFGAGSNANVGIEKPGGANVVTFHVHADTTALSNALTVGTTLNVTNTATLGNVIDSGLTANTLAYANGSKQLSSASVASPLSFSGGILSISTTTFSGSGSGFNADLLDGLDSTYFLANAYSTTSANYWLSGKTTDNLAEGSTNKYYTDARARGALSASSPLSYNSSTGAFSLGTVPIAKGGTNATSQTTNGIAYYDGTKITTDSDLTYNGSALVSNGSVFSNGQFAGFGGGAAATPSFSFNGDLTTGIFNPANNVIGFATGGIERVRIDPNGKVGIGSTSPSSELSVAGDTYLDGTLTTTGTAKLGTLTGLLSGANGTVGVATVSSPLSFSGNTLTLSTAGNWTGTFDGQEGSWYVANSFSTTSANAWLGGKSTTNLAEGTNLYFTNARARTALSVSSPLTYNSSTGVFGLGQVPLGTNVSGVLPVANGGTGTGTQSANGVAYYDGTKLTSDASKLEYDGTDLSVWTGNVISSQFIGGSGNPASTPQFTFQGDETTGIFNPANNVIGFATGGIERVRIDQNGNLGVGTTSPAYPLSVVGSSGTTLYAQNTDASSPVAVFQTTGGLYGPEGNIQVGGSNGGVIISSDPHNSGGTVSATSGTLALGTNNQAYTPLILNNNRVGVNVNYFAPNISAELEVSANGSATDLFMLSSTQSLHGDRFVVKNNGNVGIGTSTPAYALDVRLPGLTTGTAIGVGSGSDGVYGTLGFSSGAGHPFQVFGDTNDDLALGANKAEAVRITSGGNVGIGTTSPSQALSVAGNALISGTATIGTLNGLIVGTNGLLSAVATSTLGIALSDTTGTLAINRGGTNATSQSTNGVAYFDGTKLTTDASLLSLSAGGDVSALGNITAGDQFLGASGNPANVPQFSFDGDKTTGIYNPAANNIGFSTGGIERARLDANGNFGIGTSSPSATLSVAGDALVNGNIASSGYVDAGTGYSLGGNPFAYGSSTNQSTAVGIGAAPAIRTSSGLTSNTAFGDYALNAVSAGFASGLNNTAVGASALQSLVGSVLSSNGNTALGYQAGMSITTGSANTVIGVGAGSNLTTGTSNIIIGQVSAPSATASGQLNIGNAIFGTGADATGGAADADARIGIGTTTPAARFAVSGDSFLGGALTTTGTTTLSSLGTGLVKSTAGVLSNAVSGTDFAPATSGTSLLYGNGSGGFSSATVSSPLSFTGGTLSLSTVPISKGGTNATSQTTNGVAYYDGTKITTGSSLVFDGSSLSVNSGNIMDTIGQFIGAGGMGNSATPAYSFAGDLTTGIFHPASDAIGFSTGGVERARLDANGNFGIGTSSPAYALDVAGDADITGKYYVNGTQALYVPDQTNFAGSLFVGDGGNNLAHTSANQGRFNTAVGLSALAANTTGQSDTAIGYKALASNTTGQNNVAAGSNALTYNTTGSNNIGIGYTALNFNSSGGNNTGIGYQTLFYNNGSGNVALGNNALEYNTSGSNNAVFGYNAGVGTFNNSNASYNSLFGGSAGNAITTGGYNTLLGYAAGDTITTGARNIIIGYNTDAPSATGNDQLNIGNTIYGNLATGSVGIGTSTLSATLTVAGDISLTGGLYDSTATRGTAGQVLQTTGTGVKWVATSTLGFAPATTGTGLLYGNGSGGFGSATVSSPLSFTGGTLSLGTVPIAKGGTNATSQTTNGVAYFDGTKITTGTGLTYDGTDLTVGFGKASAQKFWGGSTSGASTPTFTFQGDTTTGLFHPAANTLGFSTGGIERARLDANGNFGIGTSSPTSPLTVESTSGTQLRVVNDTDYITPQAIFQGKGSVSGYDNGTIQIGSNNYNITLQYDGKDGMGFIDSDGSLLLSSGSSNTFWSESNGRVALAGAIPNAAARLEVSAVGGTDDLLLLSSSNSTHGDRFIVKNNGNVGIGTTSPFAKLSVSGDSYLDGALTATGSLKVGTGSTLSIYNGAGSTFTPQLFNSTLSGVAGIGTGVYDGTNNVRVGLFADNTNHLVGISSAYSSVAPDFVYRNAGGERFRITSGGNVGIGTSAPTQLLHIKSSVNALAATSGTTQTGILRLNGSGNGVLDFGQAGSTGAWIQSTNSSDLSTNYNLLLNPNGGNVGIGTTNPGYPLQVSAASGGTNVMRLTTNDYVAGTTGSSLAFLWGASSGNTYASIQAGNTGGSVGGPLVLQPTAGNVGIGTTSPSSALTIQSNQTAPLAISGSASSVGLSITNTNTGGSNWNIYSSANTAGYGGGKFAIFNGGNNRLTIDSAGNVGIGTSAPSNTLDVFSASDTAASGLSLNSSSGSGNSPRLYFANSSDAGNAFSIYKIGTGSSSYLSFNYNASDGSASGSTALSILDGGNVGIGTTSPSAPLEVWGSTNGGVKEYVTNSNAGTAAYSELSIRNDYGSANAMGGLRLLTLGTNWTSSGYYVQDSSVIEAGSGLSGGLSLATAGASPISFYTNGNNRRMIIDSSGNVGIGTTSPNGALQVVGNNGVTVSTLGYNGGIDPTAPSNTFYRSTASANRPILSVNNGSGSQFLVDGNGYVGIGTTTPSVALDVNYNGSGGIRLERNAAGIVSMQFANASGYFYAGIDNSGDFAVRNVADIDTANYFLIKNSNGYVGLNNTAPTDPLTIGAIGGGDKSLRINSAGATYGLITTTGTTGVLGITATNGTTAGAIALYTGPSATEAVRIAPNQNVGIGMSIPDSRLVVSNNRATDVVAYSYTPTTLNLRETVAGVRSGISLAAVSDNGALGNTGGIFFDAGTDGTVADNILSLSADTQSSMTPMLAITGAGSVGIGNTSPGEKLDVTGNIRTSGYTSYYSGLSSFNTSLTNSLIYQSGAGGTSYPFQEAGNLVLQSRPSGAARDIDFVTGTTPTVRMVVDRNGNVGIGTTSPLAALHIATSNSGISAISSGANELLLESSNTTGMSIIGGASSDQGIMFGDVNSQTMGRIIYANSTDSLQFWTTAQQRLTINSSGYVGIGTTSPDQALTVGSNTTASNQFIHVASKGDAGLLIEADTDNVSESDDPYIQFSQDGGTVTSVIGMAGDGGVDSAGNSVSGVQGNALLLNNAYSGGQLELATNGAVRFVVDSTGYVGIGTTSPYAKLSVAGDLALTGGIYDSTGSRGTSGMVLQSTGTGTQWVSGGGGGGLWSSGTGGVAYYNSGNVGIGTASPGYALDSVANTTDTSDGVTWTTAGAFEGNPGSGAAYANRILFNNTNSTNGQNVLDFAHAGVSKWYIGNDYNGNGSQTFAITDAPTGLARLYIDSTGKTGIGSTTPSSRLSVGTSASGYAADFFNDGNSVNNKGIRIQAGHDYTNVATSYLSTLIQFNNGDGSDAGSIVSGTGNSNQALNIYSGKNRDFVLTAGDAVGNYGSFNFWGNSANFNTPIQVYGGFTDNSYSDAVFANNHVGIGTTTPWGMLGITQMSGGSGGSFTTVPPGLLINNATGDSATLRLDTSNNGGLGGAFTLGVQGYTDGGNGGEFTVYDNASNAIRLVIDKTGWLQLPYYGAGTLMTDSSGHVTVSSDERLKNITGSFTRGLADIEKIDPIMFHWNAISGMDQGDLNTGFSAQNVQKAIPEAVGVDSRGYLTLQDRPILAASVNAIKELASTTDQLSFATTSLQTQFNTFSAGFAAAQASSSMPHALTATSVTAKSMDIAEGVSAGSMTTQTLSASGTVSAPRYVVPQTASAFSIGSSTVSAELPDDVLAAGGNVDLYKLASYGVASVQALSARTDLLAVKLDDLTTRVAALEAMNAATSTSAGDTAAGAVGYTVSSLKSVLASIGIVLKQGYLALDSLVTHQLVLVKGDDGTSSTGSDVIPAGSTELLVTNPLVHPSSKIFLTFTASVDGSWYLSEKKEGSFTIQLSKPQPADTEFDYFLLQTDSGALAAAGATQPAQDDQPPAGSQEAPTVPPVQNEDGGPTVSLNGSAAVQVAQGGSWTDPGATAKAADGTDLTSAITKTVTPGGSVDMSTAGTYTITYSVTDAAGKSGSASRVVVVLAPTSGGDDSVTGDAGSDTGSTGSGSDASGGGSDATNPSSGNDTPTNGGTNDADSDPTGGEGSTGSGSDTSGTDSTGGETTPTDSGSGTDTSGTQVTTTAGSGDAPSGA